MAYQPDLLSVDTDLAPTHARFNGRSGAFVDNMSLPVHRWYRYSAGFSADWVRWLIRERREKCSASSVLDPFSGVATTLLACEAENVTSYGFETHPFVCRIAKAKLAGIRASLSTLRSLFQDFAEAVPEQPPALPKKIPKLLTKCYTDDALCRLLTMRDLFSNNYDRRTPESELLWLTITAILRSCSRAGTAQWQYVLPNKSKSGVQTPQAAFQSKATEILQDIEYAQRNRWSASSRILMTDARHPQNCGELSVDAVITSPPYPNNYDYADATRLEMTFWGEVSTWGDLQEAVRQHLIRSCSQHATAERLVLEDLLAEKVLDPIRDDLSVSCRKLAEVRHTKGGRKNYHTMAAAYFRDLGLVFQSLRPLCRPDCVLCLVIGDSAPYGVYLRVDTWLGELALAAGFKSYSFEKTRDRNVKWKNRKHRVPLKEGRLWIEG
ncbi:MAG: DNA modification methylase [Planctomycetota bacterium]